MRAFAVAIFKHHTVISALFDHLVDMIFGLGHTARSCALQGSEPEPVYEFDFDIENIATVATLLQETYAIRSSIDEGSKNAPFT